MASFRTHISAGIALGALSIFGIASLALLPTDWSYYILVGLMVTIGALLPDIDSDSGLPFHITFGSLALTAGGLGAVYVWQNYPGDLPLLIGISLGVPTIIWGVIGPIFKRFTRHRGLAHSVPAAILAGLIAFLIASYVSFTDWQAFLLGIALALGYLLHLALDEVWAGLNFHGQLFIPNKAFGSALKFRSHDRRLTLAIYVAIGVLIALNFQTLSEMTRQLTVALA